MIYIETPQHYGMKLYGRKVKTPHLLSDIDLEQLHWFADRLGLERRWLHMGSLPHYDVVESKFALALELGAKEMSRQDSARFVHAELVKRNKQIGIGQRA